MWNLYHKEGWAPKNWCFQTVVLEKTFESPLDSKLLMECCPWNSPRILEWVALPFSSGSQGLNPGLIHCRQILYQLSRGVTKSWTWLNDWTELNWTARSLNQSILKEINPGYSLEGVRLKLKLQYLGHLMWRTVIRKDPGAGKDWGQEEKGWQRMRWLGGIIDSKQTWVWANSGR